VRGERLADAPEPEGIIDVADAARLTGGFGQGCSP
jgi:hypothetical protein